jgi:hypothetical protein
MRTFPDRAARGTVSEEDRTENYPGFQFEIERFSVRNRDNTRPMAGQDKIFSHSTVDFSVYCLRGNEAVFGAYRLK